ncbi:MAG TPA: amylo-alpha-1,6-glucosidase, partial [Bacteroidales bacterium]|nr:amylo-alpha-1,6-glucosidase [Bacteroidales bacterium]
KKYLADCVANGEQDLSVRPNMVIATSMPFSPIDENMRKSVLDVVRSELLTPFGLRTLSPKDSRYRSIYSGDQQTRDTAAYMGTSWPWLLGHFAEGMLRLYGNATISLIEKLYFGFEKTMIDHAIGSISELYDGDPPHKPGGAISMAWSVAEVIRIHFLISEQKLKKT